MKRDTIQLSSNANSVENTTTNKHH